LVKTVVPRRLQPRLGELLDHIGFRFAKSFAPGLAAFHAIVGDDLNVIPPRLAIEVFWRRLLRKEERRKLGVNKNCQ
jgi:hypothetical protein